MQGYINHGHGSDWNPVRRSQVSEYLREKRCDLDLSGYGSDVWGVLGVGDDELGDGGGCESPEIKAVEVTLEGRCSNVVQGDIVVGVSTGPKNARSGIAAHKCPKPHRGPERL